MSRDPRVDAYIARQADFAQPILKHLRETVHSACPGVEETLKWSMPSFLYKGKILCSMAAFKAHAAFGFWRSSDVLGETGAERDAMGQFGRLESVDDLPPPDALMALVHKAMAAIDANPAAAATFAAFPPSCRREYVEWVTEAKRDETRTKRLNQAVAWMAEGKRRHWKYENC